LRHFTLKELSFSNQIPQTAVRSNDDDDYGRHEKTHCSLSTTTHTILPWTEPEILQSKGSFQPPEIWHEPATSY
jgi:hypothetical protein